MPAFPPKPKRRSGTLIVRPGARRPARRVLVAVLKWGALIGLAGAVIAAVALVALFWFHGSDPKLPRIGALRDYRPKLVTKIVAADGTLIGELYDERRTYVARDHVAPVMVQAMIDAEDADFRTHKGLDFWGMARAFWVNLRHGETRQGASTITQQVVKTLLLSPERTLRRKVQEIILARRIERALTKDEILDLYLNQIYFGHGRYGVEEAARFFFGRGAAELEAGEAAMLAGVVQSPEKLSPLKHPEAAKARQVYVLDQMVKRGHLPAAEAQRLADAPIRVVKDAGLGLGLAPEVVEVVRQELGRRYGEEDLPYLGLVVGTTIDPKLQVAARTALENGLRALDERQGYRGPVERLSQDKAAARRKTLARELPRTGPRPGDSYDAVVLQVSDELQELLVDLGGWKGAVLLRGAVDARYNSEGKKPSQRFSPHDVVRVRVAKEAQARTAGAQGALLLDQGPQGAMVVIDPSNRHVLAMVGGYGFEPGQFNRATRAKRQPGSAFKPFVYAAALDTALFTPATIVNDAPEVYDMWKPQNYQKESFRGPVRLRVALAHSINTVAIRILHDVGVDRVIQLAHDMGIKEELPAELSLALGSGVVTPVELVNAYATLAASGAHAPPVFTVAIGDHAVAPGEPSQALRPEVAFLATSLMRSVVEEGTATAARKLKRAIAGKTGTSNGEKDAWFVGFTPELVAGVWVGFDDMRRLGRGETGGKAALPIWIDFMRTGTRRGVGKEFTLPPGVVTALIDKKTGKLAAPGAQDTDALVEYFLDGTQPVEVAAAPGEVDPSDFVMEQMDEDGGD